MSDHKGFAGALAHNVVLTETDIAVAVAWYISSSSSGREVTLSDVCEFMQEHGIRSNINRSRLKQRLTSRKDISAPKGRSLMVSAAKRKEFLDDYGAYLEQPAPEIANNILSLEDFENQRGYVKAIARQINGAFQFELYDACAVMMRRLTEIIIIDAYENKGERAQILDISNNYLMMNGLVNALKSGKTFKLSRNTPKTLETIKALGDNAAHSRTYITKQLDIEQVSQDYRRLISELLHLS